MTSGTTPKTDQRTTWLCFAAAGALCLILTACHDFIGLDAASPAHLRVFGTFWSAGWAARHGLNPFVAYALTPPANIPGVMDVNLSPPALLPVFDLLSRINPEEGVAPWIMGQAILFVSGCGILTLTARAAVRPWQIVFMLLSWEMSDSIWLAQDYGILFFLAVLGWLFAIRRRHIAAGVAIGLLSAAKPNLLLWPAFLFLAGERRTSSLAIACAALVSCLPALLYSTSLYTQWFSAVSTDRHWMFISDCSLQGFAARLGNPAAGTAASVALIAVSALIVWRCRPTLAQASAIAIVAGIIGSPLAWADYVVFLFPAFADDLWGRRRSVSAALLAVPPGIPLAFMYKAKWLLATGGLVYTGALLLIVFGTWADALTLREPYDDGTQEGEARAPRPGAGEARHMTRSASGASEGS